MILYVICQLVCVIDSWAHTSFVHSILSLKLGVTIQERDDQDLEDKIKKRHKVVVGISLVNLALALANLSSTGSASEGDQHRTKARADSTRDRQSVRFWPARSMEASRSSLSILLLG